MKHKFTLIELVCVVVVAVLAFTLVIPNYVNAQNGAKAASCENNLKNIYVYLMHYADENDGHYLAAYRIYDHDIMQNWVYYLWHNYKLDPDTLICPEAKDSFAFGKKPNGADSYLQQSYGMHYEAVMDNYNHAKKIRFTRDNLTEHGQKPEAHIFVGDSASNATKSKAAVKGRSSFLINGRGGYYDPTDGQVHAGSGWSPMENRHKGKINFLMFDGHTEALDGEVVCEKSYTYWKPMYYDWKWVDLK